MTKKEKSDVMTIFEEFYIPAIRIIIRKEVVKERGRFEANVNERLEAIEAELGIEFTPERKEISYYTQDLCTYGNRFPHYQTIPQEIERPPVSITDKMKALLKYLGIKEIKEIDHPAKTEIKVIKKGLPIRSKE